MEHSDEILDRPIPLNAEGKSLRSVLISFGVISQDDKVDLIETLQGGTERAKALFFAVLEGPDATQRLKKLVCVKLFEEPERSLFLDLTTKIRKEGERFKSTPLAVLLPLGILDDRKKEERDDGTGVGAFIYDDGARILHILGSLDFHIVGKPYEITSGIAGFSRVYRVIAEHSSSRYAPRLDVYIKLNRPNRQDEEWQVIESLRSPSLGHHLKCLIRPPDWNRREHGCAIYPTFGNEEPSGSSISLKGFLEDTGSPDQFGPVIGLLKNALKDLFQQRVELDNLFPNYRDPFLELLEEEVKARIGSAWKDDPLLSQLLGNGTRIKLAHRNYCFLDPLGQVGRLLSRKKADNTSNPKWRHEGKIELGRVHGDLQSTNILVWRDDSTKRDPRDVKFIDLERFKAERSYPIVDDLASLEADFFFSIYPKWAKERLKESEPKEQLRIGLDVLLYILDTINKYDRPDFKAPTDAAENLVNMAGTWICRLRNMARELLKIKKPYLPRRYYCSLLLHCLLHLGRRSVASEELRPGILFLVASVIEETIQRDGG